VNGVNPVCKTVPFEAKRITVHTPLTGLPERSMAFTVISPLAPIGVSAQAELLLSLPIIIKLSAAIAAVPTTDIKSNVARVTEAASPRFEVLFLFVLSHVGKINLCLPFLLQNMSLLNEPQKDKGVRK
jgi:hypothetical protein